MSFARGKQPDKNKLNPRTSINGNIGECRRITIFLHISGRIDPPVLLHFHNENKTWIYLLSTPGVGFQSSPPDYPHFPQERTPAYFWEPSFPAYLIEPESLLPGKAEYPCSEYVPRRISFPNQIPDPNPQLRIIIFPFRR